MNTPELNLSLIQKAVADAEKAAAAHQVDNEDLALLVSLMDLTTLEATDTQERVRRLCDRALNPTSGRSDVVPKVAAVCVYPNLATFAVQTLAGSGVKVASVAGAFPSGMSPLEIRLREIEWVVEQGVDEVDVVLSRGTFLSGDHATCLNELVAMKQASGKAHVKVILETGELQDLHTIHAASHLAIRSGTDFIKTSTGKVQPAATLPAMAVMLCAIRDVAKETGRIVGIKPAGGIRDTRTAMAYVMLTRDLLGEDWLHPDRFRIGASSLLDDVVSHVE